MADVELESPGPVWDDQCSRERDQVERVVDDGLLGVFPETHPDDVTAYTEATEPTILSLVDEAYDRGYGAGLLAFAPTG